MNEIQKREDTLFERISALIEEARKRVVTAVNVAEVYTKYGIGQYIVEDEQQGEQRAKYGKAVLKNLSIRLTDKYGEGWSVETLDKCRKFYRVFSGSGISSTMQTKLKIVNSVDEIDKGSNNILGNDKQCMPNSSPTFTLSWSHYLILMRNS